MTSFRILKPSITSTLITLVMALQMSACSSTKEPAEAVAVTNEADSTLAGVNLTWAAPHEREDNTEILLSEIAGYKIYYGATQGNYSSSIDINDGSAAGYTFTGLSAGTYYFIVTTYDTEGRESQFSSEVKIII